MTVLDFTIFLIYKLGFIDNKENSGFPELDSRTRTKPEKPPPPYFILLAVCAPSLFQWIRLQKGQINDPGKMAAEGGGRGNNPQGCRSCRVARADRDSPVSAFGVGLPSGAPFPVQAPDNAPETWTWSTRSEGGRDLLSRNLNGNPMAWKCTSVCWTMLPLCRVARGDRDSQVSAFGVGLPSVLLSGAPQDRTPETCTWLTRSEGGLANLLSRNLDGNQIA